MCKQGVMIGRSTELSRAAVSPVAAASEALFNPDADRLALTVSLVSGVAPVVADLISIQAIDGGTATTIATLSLGRPSVILTLEEYGILLLGGLQVLNNGANTYTIHAVSLRLTKDLREI